MNKPVELRSKLQLPTTTTHPRKELPTPESLLYSSVRQRLLHYAIRCWNDLVMQPGQVLKPLKEMDEEWVVFILRRVSFTNLVLT